MSYAADSLRNELRPIYVVASVFSILIAQICTFLFEVLQRSDAIHGFKPTGLFSDNGAKWRTIMRPSSEERSIERE